MIAVLTKTFQKDLTHLFDEGLHEWKKQSISIVPTQNAERGNLEGPCKVLIDNKDGTVETPSMEDAMSGEQIPQPGLSFFRRLSIAGINLLTPLHTGVIVTYFVVRELNGGEQWLIDALSYVLPWLILPVVFLLPGILIFRRSRSMLILIAIPMALFLLSYGHLYLPRLPVRSNGQAFTVMTYNIFMANTHVDAIAAAIEKENPDIIGIHEITPLNVEFLDEPFAERYPYRRIDKWMGLLSKYPILEYKFFRLSDGEGTWAQRFVLDIDGNEVTLYNVHPPSPPLVGINPFGLPIGIPTGFLNKWRDADIRDLVSRLDQVDGPLLVIGDFNIVDQQNMYEPLTDYLRDAHRESGWGMGFTFSRYPQSAPSMWRIDYVFHSTDMVAVSATTGDYGGSDHRPVIAKLDFRVSD